jgi:citrate synthase
LVYLYVNIDCTINMKSDQGWLSAADAAKELGVNRATLYAYVSRGHIRSEARAGAPRERRYSREDVDRLRRRNEERRDPEKAAGRALQWGMPILESAITLIAGGKLYYRGYDVVSLARERPVEDVASLIWTGSFGTDFSETPLHVVSGNRGDDGLPFVARAQSVLAVVAARDPLAFDLRPRAVAMTGWRILNLLTSVAAATRDLAPAIEETLVREWGGNGKAAELIRAALILIADHELNVSSFTARCVASAGSNPYAAVIAGLAALEGTKHGGASIRVESLLEALRRTRGLDAALAERLRRGESVEGFGHRLYRDGDPRAIALMRMIDERYPKSPELDFARQLAASAESILGEKPTVDFALAALARVLKLPKGAPLTLFALGRTIGWIGHAIEQYADDKMIRPRARYVGEKPR